MQKSTRYIILIVVVLVLVGLFVWYKTTPGTYDKLAQCLSDQKVTFFGAFWCPHCQEAKKNFSKSTKYLNYVECSTPDGKDQNQTCRDAHIPGYPTWEYSNAVTVAVSESDKSFACSSPEGAVEDNCRNALPGTWHTQAGGQSFLSPTQPTKTATTWTLPPYSRSIGTTDPVVIGTLANCSVN